MDEIYNTLGLDCNADSARHKIDNLFEHLRDNPKKYLPLFKMIDIEKYLRKKKLDSINV